MKTIDAECIIGNLLVYFDVATTRHMSRIVSFMARKLPDVYVDITDDARVQAVNDNPRMFKFVSLDSHEVARVKRFSKEYVRTKFNCFLSQAEEDVLRRAIRLIRKNPDK